MSALRAALILILAGGATPAFAEQITCQSDQDRPDACTTVLPGSRVRLVEQLSRTPCVEGQNWGVDTNHGSIWVSRGCRAVFDPRTHDPALVNQFLSRLQAFAGTVGARPEDRLSDLHGALPGE